MRLNGFSLVPASGAVFQAALRSFNAYGHELELQSGEDGSAGVIRLPVPLPSVYGADMVRPMEGVAFLRLAAIRETVYRRSLPLATRDLVVQRSSLGALAGVVGASAMVLEQLFSRDFLARWLSEGGVEAEGGADISGTATREGPR